MINKHSYILFLIITCLFIAISCKKEIVIPSNTQELDTQVQNYIFKQGTYWIYEDLETGIEDSVYVVSLEKINYKYASNKAGYNFECYKMTTKNKDGITNVDYIFSNQIRRNAEENNPAETGQLIYYHFINDGIDGEKVENFQEVEYIKYYTDGFGNRWNNSYRFWIEHNGSYDGDYITYSDEAGIIYYTENLKDINQRKINSLKRWHLVK